MAMNAPETKIFAGVFSKRPKAGHYRIFMASSYQYIALGASLVALGLSVYIFIAMRSLNRLRASFFAGKNGTDLEAAIHALILHIENLEDNQTALENALVKLQKDFAFSVQRIGMVRFNPFEDGGGNLSFSIALLNGQGSGLVLTSMHGRDQNRIYTKRVVNGSGEIQLTQEEQDAIARAHEYFQPV